MIHPKPAPLQWTVCVCCLSLVACRGSTEATADDTSSPADLVLSPASFSPACVQPGEILKPGPSVVVTGQLQRPVPGVEVSFHTDEGEQLSQSVAFTDAHGVAATGSWRLSDVQGTHTLIASIVGGPSAKIQIATETGSRVTGGFDLITIGNHLLPYTVGMGTVLTAAHLFFAENRTSRIRHEWGGAIEQLPEFVCYGAPYVVGASQVDFYWPVSNPALDTIVTHGQHFATATLRGDTLSLRYDDGENADEVYVLRTGANPLNLSSAR